MKPITNNSADTWLNRHYVYVLIDPTNNNEVFYVGKGVGNRPDGHFQNVSIGQTADGILKDEELNKVSLKGTGKITKIKAILSNNTYTKKDIVRVIARNLEEHVAEAIEAFLIKFHYGKNNLTNINEAKHSERFRAHNNWAANTNFDDTKTTPFYVYVLLDPSTQDIFYVGKGTKNRLNDHFNRAEQFNSSLTDVEPSLKLSKLKELLEKGCPKNKIGYIIARVEKEDEAFAIESLSIKFVFGFKNTSNIKKGNKSGRFRSKNDWQLRVGFDLSYIVHAGNGKQIKADQLDQFLGEELDIPLIEVRDHFDGIPPNNISFGELGLLDSNDLSIEADVAIKANVVARIKVFTRVQGGIQVELRWRNVKQRLLIKEHFTKLQAYALKRADDVFVPQSWRNNLISNSEQAIHRVNLLIEILKNDNRTSLAKLHPEAYSLLLGLPRVTEAKHKNRVYDIKEIIDENNKINPLFTNILFECILCGGKILPIPKTYGKKACAMRFEHFIDNPNCSLIHPKP